MTNHFNLVNENELIAFRRRSLGVAIRRESRLSMSCWRESPNNGGARGLVTPVFSRRTMDANLQSGSLGMGVIVGAELIRTGLQNGNRWVAVAGATICGSGLVLGFVVAHTRSRQADRSKDAKAK